MSAIQFIKKLTLAAFFIFLSTTSYAQISGLQKYIRTKSEIKEGGTAIFNYQKENYIITVSSLVVGNKSEVQCRTVGSAKVKRDMLAYVNGSEITSEVVFVQEERVVNGKASFNQNYTETIRETVRGSINEIRVLDGWYSEDHTVYYFAMFKIL